MTSLRITRDDLRAALAAPGPSLTSGPIDMSQARPAAVAVLVGLAPEPVVHLVLRSSHLADHAGEIAFPGGKQDPADESLRATAARELHEEVGVREDQIEWLGELSRCPVITGRYCIHPFVALLAEGAVPRVASGEIAEVLSLPIARYLTGEDVVHAIDVEWRGVRVITPHFPIGPRILYGATAAITYELLWRLAASTGRELAPLRIVETVPWAGRYE